MKSNSYRIHCIIAIVSDFLVLKLFIISKYKGCFGNTFKNLKIDEVIMYRLFLKIIGYSKINKVM